MVILGTILQFTSFVLIALNIPNNAPTEDDIIDDTATINPSNPGLALLCSFLLGFGDACYNTQTLSLLGKPNYDKSF